MPKQPSLALLGTDKLRVTNFQMQINKEPATTALAHTLTELKTHAYAAEHVTPAEQANMEGNHPAVLRETTTYSARPLAGVWATAPYLHNNSVPTLAHLLKLEKRPAAFTLTKGDYDTVNVGLPFK